MSRTNVGGGDAPRESGRRGVTVKVVVVADGEPVEADVQHLADADLVIAADGGSSWLIHHGRRPDLVVGDLDSLDAAAVEQLTGLSVQGVRRGGDKECVDWE